ncbi:VOC family protein [Undibacterium sp. TJN19]|uniref:VOC family protein n=1 Tax=Undibacterium sp. TJN19 TaxID=3413055 RepID=UPI003BEFA75A
MNTVSSRCVIDHITVTAPTLVSGAAYVHQILGVAPLPGGEHPRMATHNMLLRLGEALFLEIIAPNPLAPNPDRPRWFELDRLDADSPPRLSNWVVRSTDIHAALHAAKEDLGNIEPMSRGSNHWLITIPEDGSLPMEGLAPALIEWHTDQHPASKMPDMGLSLVKLELLHADAGRVLRLLNALELQDRITVKPISKHIRPQLIAHIQTPHGICILS